MAAAMASPVSARAAFDPDDSPGLEMDTESKPAIRSVSFVGPKSIPVDGRVHQKAIALGDIDNDSFQDNELIVGTAGGKLYGFKGDPKQPWITARDLGTITCLAIGDVRGSGKNSLVALTMEGLFHLFDVNGDELGTGLQHEVRPAVTQSVAQNISCVIISDVDNDGTNELLFGSTDRCVYVYKFNAEQNRIVQCEHWVVPGQVRSLSTFPMHDETTGNTGSNEDEKAVGEERPEDPQQQQDKPPHDPPNHREKSEMVNIVLVGLQSSDFVFLRASNGEWWRPLGASGSSDLFLRENKEDKKAFVSMEVLGGIGSRDDPSLLLATVALSGVITLRNSSHRIWKLEVDNQVFSVNKLDITNNGRDDIVVCAWDGTTYMIGQDSSIAKFRFENRVCTFVAGHYSAVPGQSKPCFVYIPFTGGARLYPNVEIASIQPRTMFDEMKEHIDEFSSLIRVPDLPDDPPMEDGLMTSPQDVEREAISRKLAEEKQQQKLDAWRIQAASLFQSCLCSQIDEEIYQQYTSQRKLELQMLKKENDILAKKQAEKEKVEAMEKVEAKEKVEEAEH